ncbi:tyrosine-type recombinase/integrase [Citricoccus parietis]|uniref:Tyrosine-type recombinase/integrase n=1 Tax=Citricoccus parietis TaxID=592307 RepID=A0ABV6F5K6_9MICC
MAHVRTVPRKTGQAYEVVWKVGSTRKQKTFTVKREADRFALKVENELAAGNSTEPLAGRSKTFREVAEACLDADRPRLKPKTIEGYEDTLRLHIYPTLGTRRIAAVTSQDVEKWVADLRAMPKSNGKPRSETSVRTAYSVLQKIFTYAARHRLISHDPTAAVPKPRTSHYVPNFLTVGEVEEIAGVLDAWNPYGTIVRFAAWTGLRSGELGALRIRDIDLMHKEVRVERTMSWVRGEWLYTAPKSERSKRTVPLLDEGLIAEMKTLLNEHPHRADPDAGLWPGKIRSHAI